MIVQPDFLQTLPTETPSLPITPAEFCERHYFLGNGQRFGIGPERRYLLPIYNIRHHNIVIVASRQAEKSTYLGNMLCYNLHVRNYDSATYATAYTQQVRDFSNLKINRQFILNPELRRCFLGPGTVNNIFLKIFRNGSRLYLVAIGQNAESARGISARGVVIDEIQSIPSDQIMIVLEQTQSFPEDAYYIFVGTPLTPSNPLSKRYAGSKQFEWIITCLHCHKQNPPLGMEHINSKKPFLFCIFCGKEMNPMNGRWVAQNPNSQYPGFRICRLMTPTCRWRTDAQDGILDKYDGANAYPEYRYLNEVLGLPAETGIAPITSEILYKCAGDFDMIDPENPPESI